jgi:hypothetical protein
VLSLKSSFIILLLAFAFAAANAAAPVPPAARAEIDALMSRLEASACEFNRNGAWHTATEARSHLLRKLKYLEDQGAVQTAEQFIALVATGSSVTGAPYAVRCGSDGPVPSEKWLSSQLRLLRSPDRAGGTR